MAVNEGWTIGNPILPDAAPHVQLVIQAGSHECMKISCHRVVTLLGSRDGCKVTLKHKRVSPVHLALVNNGLQIFAIDLVTRHGTLLNGLKMQHEHLSDGDVLTLAPWEFRVDIQESAQSGDADVHPFDLEPSPRMVTFEHIESGRLLKPGRDLCTIGRRNGCDIVISDPRVSRAHALLLGYYGRRAIVDLLSGGRTFINDKPIEFHFLEDGDLIRVGDSQFRTRLIGSPIGGSASGDVPDSVETTVALTTEERGSDLVDIRATETLQPWRIADRARPKH